MSDAKTLLQMSGAPLAPSRLSDACLVLIDIQNEYCDGPLRLPDVHPAIARAEKVLSAARQAGSPIFHIAHKGREGSLFDRSAKRGAIVDQVAPMINEPIVEKALPNAFAGTDLAGQIEGTGRKEIVIVGFMTHMCVSSTARAALDLGLRVTVDADACATRDLPDGVGGTLAAATIHHVALAELSDRFAIIARDHDWTAAD